jgi:four helix bundle protein
LPIFDCRLRDQKGKVTEMTPDELKARTKAFALRVVNLADAMPPSPAAQVIGRQLLRSATSVGANYRAACRAQSRADFAARLSIVIEETDEALYWLEPLEESGVFKGDRLAELRKEANELLSIVIASRKTAKTVRPIRKERRPLAVANRKSAIP